MKVSQAAAIAVLFAVPSLAHTWIDQMQVIGDDGKYTGDYGYARGYVEKAGQGFTGNSDNYLNPPLASDRTRIDNTDLLCHPQQRSATQSSDKYPRLQAAPGDYFAMKYTENGHVTLNKNQPGKPKNGGTVFVYGTTQPKTDEKIADVLQWTKDGSGGDKRGKLLAINEFDDGRCYELNSSPESAQRQQQFPDHIAGQPNSKLPQWCETDVQLPNDAPKGKAYTVYWVWQWPTVAGGVANGGDAALPNGKDEYYSTCSDVDIIDKTPTNKAQHSLIQQDPQTTAVTSYKSRTALTTDALAVTHIFSTSGAGGSNAPASTTASGAISSKSAPGASSAKSTPAAASSKSTGSGAQVTANPSGGLLGEQPAASSAPAAGPVTVTVTEKITIQASSPAATLTTKNVAGVAFTVPSGPSPNALAKKTVAMPMHRHVRRHGSWTL